MLLLCKHNLLCHWDYFCKQDVQDIALKLFSVGHIHVAFAKTSGSDRINPSIPARKIKGMLRYW